jgi:hypothetical protein
MNLVADENIDRGMLGSRLAAEQGVASNRTSRNRGSGQVIFFRCSVPVRAAYWWLGWASQNICSAAEAVRVMSLRRGGIWFLLAEAVGAAAWWCLLLAFPSTRVLFMAQGAPDSTLLAFAAADGVLFVGTAAASAYGLWAGRSWGWPLLCVHAGAAGYAGLYCWTLTGMTGGDGLLGAILMSPSLIVPGWLAVRLRPGSGSC